MQITNKRGAVIAYLQRKLIIDAEKKSVVGLVLDTYVYNAAGEWCGKFFDNLFRNKEGNITAKFDDHFPGHVFDNAEEIAVKGWHIVEKIKRYNWSWIPALNVWANNDLLFYLK